MKKIDRSDLFVSVVGHGQEEEFLRYDFQTNVEIAYFAQPHILDSDWRPRAEFFLKLLQEKDRRCSLHGPFAEMNYQSKDTLVQAAVKKRFSQILEVAQLLKPCFIIFHSTYNPLGAQADKEERWLEAAYEFWRPVVDQAEKLGVTFAIENIYDDRPEPIQRLIRRVDSPRLKACIDIGHWFLFSKLSLSHWFEVYGEDLAYFHLHDNQGVHDDHGAIGTGKIPFHELFTALEKSPAQPKYCIEVQTVKYIDESLAYLTQQGWLTQPA